MFNKKNPMRYFSGSTFVRLPLYKLAAGGTAVALTASIGLGAFAAGFTPFTTPEPSPTPVVTATPETAATPTPSPLAKPDTGAGQAADARGQRDPAGCRRDAVC